MQGEQIIVSCFALHANFKLPEIVFKSWNNPANRAIWKTIWSFLTVIDDFLYMVFGNTQTRDRGLKL